MSWFGADKEITAIGDVVKNTGSALDSLFTSDEERLNAAEIMARINQKPAEWAHELNVINAKSGSWFNSGWRPAIGWVGATGLAIYYIPQYLMATVLWVHLNWGADVLTAYPVSADGIWQIVTVLLGNSALRSFEKKEGVHAK